MNKFLISSLIFLISALSNVLYALTLQDCIDKAVKNNILISAYEKKIQSSIEGYKQDTATLYPNFSISNGIGFSNVPGNLQEKSFEDQLVFKIDSNYQNIISNYPKASYFGVKKSKLIKEILKYDIEKAVSGQYYRLYVFLQIRTDYLNAEKYFEDHIKDIEALKNAGVDVNLDLERAKIKYRLILFTIENTNTEIENILIYLNMIMDTALTASDFISMQIPEINLDESYFDNIELKYSADISTTNQYKLDQLDIDIAKELYNQSRFYYLPALGAEVDTKFNSNYLDNEYKFFFTVDWNIFNWGQQKHKSLQLKYEYESVKKQFEDNHRNLKIKILQLAEVMENTQSSYKIAVLNVKDSKNILELSKSYYKQGKIKETDLLDIFSSYLEAKQQLYDAIINYFSKKTELDYFIKGVQK